MLTPRTHPQGRVDGSMSTFFLVHSFLATLTGALGLTGRAGGVCYSRACCVWCALGRACGRRGPGTGRRRAAAAMQWGMEVHSTLLEGGPTPALPAGRFPCACSGAAGQ